MKKEFDLNHQYQLYLQRVGIKDESKLHPVQRIEMRRVFFGAVGQLLLLLRDDLTKYSEEEGEKILKGMLQQVTNFWLKEKNETN